MALIHSDVAPQVIVVFAEEGELGGVYDSVETACRYIKDWLLATEEPELIKRAEEAQVEMDCDEHIHRWCYAGYEMRQTTLHFKQMET